MSTPNWISFTPDQQTQLLEKWGFTIKEVERTQAFSVYHNDVEYEDYQVRGYQVRGVFDSEGNPFQEPTGHYHRINSFDWIGRAFDSVLKEKFFTWLSQNL